MRDLKQYNSDWKIKAPKWDIFTGQFFQVSEKGEKENKNELLLLRENMCQAPCLDFRF